MLNIFNENSSTHANRGSRRLKCTVVQASKRPTRFIHADTKYRRAPNDLSTREMQLVDGVATRQGKPLQPSVHAIHPGPNRILESRHFAKVESRRESFKIPAGGSFKMLAGSFKCRLVEASNTGGWWISTRWFRLGGETSESKSSCCVSEPSNILSHSLRPLASKEDCKNTHRRP